MDKDTRNQIQRATQDARALLEREYAEQLEGVFDIRLDGTIATAPGEHLDATHRVLRTKLVAAVEHQCAGGLEKNEAVAAYLREAAFTTLNRFVAIKMLEARGLVQECISRGEQSAGFKEFTGLAPGLVQLPDHGYRIYIEALFDEIGREVRVLFDRRDPASLLWPRRLALLDLIAILNTTELGSVWQEDETIGWVYQYFNNDDDRQKARYDDKGKPKAPQSSYELAVRNQFFTPRYVVEFLTDNALGRIWYEMRQGDTKLHDLDYLVARPNEVFLGKGQKAPPDADDGGEELTREELLQRPVYVAFRAKKDPRDLRVLDPACGSGHFLLYAFDLLAIIYEEAWRDEKSPASEASGRRLCEDYGSIKELRRALPDLVLYQNLHGIEIDPRAAQIAALALWMRAQRAYHDFAVSRAGRPAIAKTNIVVAEPMPGEKELRKEFAGSLDRQLGELVESVFEKMELAGEAGSLLKIEEEIQSAVRDVYQEAGELFRKTDEDRWRAAESELLLELNAYAEKAHGGAAYQRRLFAEDAARGLGFIDLCRQRYDVVLMNPPFGEPTDRARQSLQNSSDLPTNLYALFVDRAGSFLKPGGMLGAITDSTFLKQPSFLSFRQRVLLRDMPLRVLVDLGWGVLDANVRTAMYVCAKPEPQCSFVLAASIEEEPQASILVSRVQELGFTALPLSYLRRLPKAVLAIDLDPHAGAQLVEMPSLGTACELPWGVGANDSAMLFRLRWEVAIESIGSEWLWLTNGGKPSPFYRENYLVCRAKLANGDSAFEADFRAGTDKMYDASAKHLIGQVGLTHPKRTNTIHFSFLQAGHVVSPEGKGVFPRDGARVALPSLCGLLNSSFVGVVSSWLCGPHKQRGDVELFPLPALGPPATTRIGELAVAAARVVASLFAQHETSLLFRGIDVAGRSSPSAVLDARRDQISAARDFVRETISTIDNLVAPALQPQLRHYAKGGPLLDGVDTMWADLEYSPLNLLGYATGCALGRWNAGGTSTQEWSWAEPVAATSPAHNTHGVSHGGILTDDPGHARDLVSAIEDVFAILWPGRHGAALQDLETLLGGRTIRAAVSQELFASHVKTHTEGRRKAPIYWQLATPSASYSVWLYYHRLTKDTFYQVLNDYVEPKLQHEERKRTRLVQSAAGSPTVSQRREIAELETFVDELRAFRDEVARIAPIWKPNLNDGVIINFAQLWRLVPQHRSWQKECKACWDKLVAGDYNWAHVAMHLWPERVVPKCTEDRSLAIAHGLEGVFWYEDSEGKWQPGKVDRRTVDKLIKDRTSAAVKDALMSLVEAPAPAASRGGSRRKSSSTSRSRRKRATSAAKERTGGTTRGSQTTSPDAELLSNVKDAIAANGHGASKADVIEATGVTATQWNTAIKALLADGSVTEKGERRGTRYHPAGGDA